MFVRIVKVPSSSGVVHEYVRVVESCWENGRVKQNVVANLGRKDFLAGILPNLYKVVRGEALPGDDSGQEIQPVQSLTWGPVLVARTLFDQLGLWKILEAHLGRAKTLPFADRAFALIANRLTRPTSEHGLARWLETDFVCDRQGRRIVPQWETHGRVKVNRRQLQSWYRTLDQLAKAKDEIEVALYKRLRDLFSINPDLVFYDITSTYFEGHGPEDFARHGHSRDGKPRNPQVVVGMVMVNGWPVAHHVFAGNTLDKTTVQDVVDDLQKRFSFGRIVFVGDRGMVSAENLEALRKSEHKHGYLVGVKRRRNPQLHLWLDQLTDDWIDCPAGITAGEKTNPPRTRVQEVPSGDPDLRVFVIDSDERRAYEKEMRERAIERTRGRLEKLKARVASGKLKKPEDIGAAAQRALSSDHGYRYFAWELKEDGKKFRYFEHPTNFEREKRLDGKYIIATSEKRFSAQQAVSTYKELSEVEFAFRHLKNLVGLRPIFHQSESRTRAHIFVAALGFLLERLLDHRLKEAEVDLSSAEALESIQTVRHVTFDVGESQRTGVTPGSPRAQQVLNALGITNRHPPSPPTPGATMK